jgi:hypothetical protein
MTTCSKSVVVRVSVVHSVDVDASDCRSGISEHRKLQHYLHSSSGSSHSEDNVVLCDWSRLYGRAYRGRDTARIHGDLWSSS